MMQIHGFQKLTLVDFPGRVAAILFTGACNFRCPFCQNASLVLHPDTEPMIDDDEIFSYLRKRKGMLDGVVVTGGEPTLQPDLFGYLSRLKEEGYAVTAGLPGLDTSLIEESIGDLLEGHVPYEMRTTVVHELHSDEDFEEIGQMCRGAASFYLQTFSDSGDIIGKNFTPPSAEDMERYIRILRKTIGNVSLRDR